MLGWQSSAKGSWQIPRDHLPAPRAGNPSVSGLTAVLGRLWPMHRVIAGGQGLFEGGRAGRGSGPAAAEPCSCTALREGPRWHCHAPGHGHKGCIQELFLAHPGAERAGQGSSSTATHPRAAAAAPAWQHQAPGDRGTCSGTMPPSVAAWSPAFTCPRGCGRRTPRPT